MSKININIAAPIAVESFNNVQGEKKHRDSFISICIGHFIYPTERIYPLVFIHSLIAISSGIDRLYIDNYEPNPIHFMDSILVITLLYPYLAYAIYLVKTQK